MIPLNFRFGEFVACRRKQLELGQKDIEGVSRSYMATIETGEQFPRTEKTVRSIYDCLKIFELNRTFDWFRVYAFLDVNPDKIFGQYHHIENPILIEILHKIDHLPEYKQKRALAVIDACLQWDYDNGINAINIAESLASYSAKHSTEITENLSKEEVKRRIGKPDEEITAKGQTKWIYNQKGLHILFEDGQVKDVLFK